jgi:hypothetical protein
VKIAITREPAYYDGWANLLLADAVDGIPEVDAPIRRIFVEDSIQHIERDLVEHVFASWRDHEQVSSLTLLAIIAPDGPRARRLFSEGKIDEVQLKEIVETGAWEPNGGEIYHALRRVGWGVASRYNVNLLMLDQWPVSNLEPWQFAALCRAIK